MADKRQYATLRPALLRLRRSNREPRLGIVFFVDGALWVHSTAFSNTKAEAGFRNEDLGHPEYWAQLAAQGKVPRDREYEEFPRGRVVYDVARCQYTLMADACILRQKKLVQRILRELHRPAETEVVADSHYRCSKCMTSKMLRDEED